MAGNTIQTSLLFNIASSVADLNRNLTSAENRITKFGGNIAKLGGAIGVAFSAQAVGAFILDVSKLAGEADGVKKAFDKLPGSIALLEDMKRATQGTVSELNLMKRAVAFSNFGLDLQQLPKLLEFATKRAQQTGQSVDYLVDSIVTGLGRKCFVKSTMILMADRSTKRIIDVHAGDSVLSYSFDGDLIPAQVEVNMMTGTLDVFELTLTNGFKVTGTVNHPLWTNKGWVHLGKITDELVKTISGYFGKQSIEAKGKEKVYDLCVPATRNFIANGISVSNSVLILDNLGVSSQQLNAEIAKTGDFFGSVGNIVDKSLAQMGDSIENNLTKTQRLSASYENLKVALGNAANGTGILGGALDALTATIDVAASDNLSFFEKLVAFASGNGLGVVNAKLEDMARQTQKVAAEQKKAAQIQREVDKAFVEFGGDIEKYASVIQTHIYRTELLEEFTKRLTAAEQAKAKTIENITNLQERLTELQGLLVLQTGQQLAKTNQEIKAIDEKIKKLKELGVEEQAQIDRTKIPKTISDYQSQLKSANSGVKKDSFGSQLGVDTESMADSALAIDNVSASIDKYIAKSNEMAAASIEAGATMDTSFADIGVGAVDALSSAFQGFADGSITSMKDVLQVTLSTIRQLIVAKLAQALASTIANSASSGPPPIALALAAIGIAGFSALFAKLPAFSSGGYHSGGLALVGEKGPEIISSGAGRIYNNKDTMKMLNGGSNSVASGSIVRGEDIYTALNATLRRRGRPTL